MASEERDFERGELIRNLSSGRKELKEDKRIMHHFVDVLKEEASKEKIGGKEVHKIGYQVIGSGGIKEAHPIIKAVVFEQLSWLKSRNLLEITLHDDPRKDAWTCEEKIHDTEYADLIEKLVQPLIHAHIDKQLHHRGKVVQLSPEGRKSFAA